MSGKPLLHLPDLLYGGLDAVADMLDERGSEATIQELSCALVNIAHAVQSHVRIFEKLEERIDSAYSGLESLQKIAQSQLDVHKSGSAVVEALSAHLDGKINALRADLEALRRELTG